MVGARVIGHYAGIPVRVCHRSEVLWATVAVDAMVDPTMRRRGVMTALARAAHAAWKDAGVAFVIGLPNEQWGSLLGALEWQPLFELRWLVHPLRPEALIARRFGWPSLSRLHLLSALWRAYLHGTAVSHEGLELTRWASNPETFRLRDAIHLERDSGWLQHRYLDCPTRDYEIWVVRCNETPAGCAIFHLSNQSGRVAAYLADVFPSSEQDDIRRRLIRTICKELEARGADMVLTLAAPQSHLYSALRGTGFWPRRAAFTVHVVPLAPDLDLAELRTPLNWHIAGGDFDVI
jgi:predicted N-acetyltransferase YhbS